MWKVCENFCCCKVPAHAGSSSSSTSYKSCPASQQENMRWSRNYHYIVKEFMGKGKFGKVVKCVNLITSQEVALKILKTKNIMKAYREIYILDEVSVLDPVRKNVVQFLDRFVHKGHACLAFELLDRSLLQLLRDRDMKPLSLSEIRPIAQQVVTALDALKGIGIIHTDIKPDNIMLVNHADQPFRVKVIDFGVAFTTSESTSGMTIQALGYRAPEVLLGLHISEAVDTWSLGCVLAFLHLGKNPFSSVGEYEMMRDIVLTLGQPSDHLLDAGDFTLKFFKKKQFWHNPEWWMKTPREYQLYTDSVLPKRFERYFGRLNSLIYAYPEMLESIELEDKRAFVSLLKCILEIDPEKRITPEEALRHPFVSMAHMKAQRGTGMYVKESFDLMSVVPTD